MLLALAEYARATGETEPLALATTSFELMQRHLGDPTAGGFFEAAQEDWTPIRGAQARPNRCRSGAPISPS